MQPAKTIKEKIRHSLHLERALRLVWQSAPGWTAANFGLILIQGLLPLVSLYLMKLIVDAVFNRDYPVVQGVVLATALIFVLLSVVADMLYMAINPRLRNA
jgi:ABC-type microcin C transport system permease subunit YejB